MNTEDAKTVQIGESLNLKSIDNTPGRNYGPAIPTGPVKILNIKTEGLGYVHFDIGLKLEAGEPPLKSRDTDDEIDGSDTYWLHPHRFDFLPF